MLSIEKLSSRQRKILAYVHLNATASYDQVARECGTKSYTVRAEVQELTRQKIIFPTLVFNHALAGFLKTNVYLTTIPLRIPERKKIVDFFLQHPRISWACELIGEFNFGLSIMARDVPDFDRTINDILGAFPRVFRKREILFISEWLYLGKKYLIAPDKVRGVVHTEYNVKPIPLSVLDSAILKVLCVEPFAPHRKISEKLNLPLSTVHHHLQTLTKKGVISGCMYWINYSKIRLCAYRLLISFGGISQPLKKKIAQFAVTHPNVVSLLFTVGAWDVEFGVDLENAHDIHAIISQLKEFAQGEIFDVISLLRFDDLRWNTVPPGVFDVS